MTEREAEQERRAAPESDRSEEANLLAAVLDSQELSVRSEPSLELKCREVGSDNNSSISQEDQIARRFLRSELAGVTAGSPVDDFLKAGGKAARQEILNSLVKLAMNQGLDTAIGDLSAANRLEALIVLANSTDRDDSDSQSDRYESLLNLARLEREPGPDGGKVAQFLNELFAGSTLDLQRQIVTARGTVDIEQRIVDDVLASTLDERFFDGDRELLDKLETHNRLLLSTGRTNLFNLARLCCGSQPDDAKPADRFDKQGEPKARLLKQESGVVLEFTDGLPPRFVSITNPDGTYARFDEDGRVIESKGKDGQSWKFSYQGDKLISFSDNRGAWEQKRDEVGNEFYQNTSNNETFKGDLSVSVAVDQNTGQVLLTVRQQDLLSGETKTTYPDGSMLIVDEGGSRRLYNSSNRLVEVANARSGESYRFKWAQESGKLQSVTTPAGLTWVPDADLQVWTSEGGKQWYGQIKIDQDSGNYYCKSKGGEELFWSRYKAAERISDKETRSAVEALYESLHSRWGADIDRFEKILEGKSVKQREAIEHRYEEKTGGRSIESDLRVRFSCDSSRVTAINALKHPGDGSADYAGGLALAFMKYKESFVGTDAATEIRSYLLSRSFDEINAIREQFPERLKMAGVPVQSLDKAIASLSEPAREACQILVKGIDKLGYADFERLSKLACDAHDLDLFIGIWKVARPEYRAAHLRRPTTEQEILTAFPGSLADRVSKKGIYVDAGKAFDVLQFGFVGADKFVREASTYLYGDFELHIDSALRNMTDRERQLFVEGEKLAVDNSQGAGLKGEQLLALQRYKAIHEALATAGYAYEVHRWEDIITGGGGLIAELAESKGVVYDSSTDSVMRTIENVGLQDFERLRTDPSYRKKVEAVIESFADGNERDPNSEVARCLALIDRKCRIEPDIASMPPAEAEKFARGRELFASGELKSLSRDQEQALRLYSRVGEKADLSSFSDEERHQYAAGQKLAGDLEDCDFYRRTAYSAAQSLSRRSIFEVIDDNVRFYGNDSSNILKALSDLRPDESKLLVMSQAVFDGKVHLESLPAQERKKYQEALEFRRRLEERLPQVLDRSTLESASAMAGKLERFLSRGNAGNDGFELPPVFYSSTEREVAAAIIHRIGSNAPGQQNIVEKLKVYSTQLQPDKAQIALDIKEALSENPNLANLAKKLAQAEREHTIDATLKQLDPVAFRVAVNLLGAMRSSLGSALYQEYGSRLLDGSFSAVDQLYLRTVDNLWDDKLGLLKDLDALSIDDRRMLLSFLPPEADRLAYLIEGKSSSESKEIGRQFAKFQELFGSLTGYEKAILENAVRNGMQPEDWLRHHIGDEFDGTDEEGIKEVFGRLTDRETVKRELSSKSDLRGGEVTETMITAAVNQRIEAVFAAYAGKYGQNLADKLVAELGGDDLKRVWRLTRKQSDNVDDSTYLMQREFFSRLGLGADFTGLIGYGASTAVGRNAYDDIVKMQAWQRVGLQQADILKARELADKLFEASLQMDETQTQLSDTVIDIGINVACLLATIPSAGSSLALLGANMGGKVGPLLKTVGTVLEAMDKAGKIAAVSSRTEFLATWFKQASRAEQMIALGITGGAAKVGFKSQFGGSYDLASEGPRDFISGFADMALNVDIPLGKWSRSAAGRTVNEFTQMVSNPAAGVAEKVGIQVTKQQLVADFKQLVERGIDEVGERALSRGGKIDSDAVAALAERLVKQDIPDREHLVADLARSLQRNLDRNMQQDMRMSQALVEALMSSRQGALAGGLGALAYADPDASIQQNLTTVAIGAGFGGALNFALALPIEVAARKLRAKVAGGADYADGDRALADDVEATQSRGQKHVVEAGQGVIGSHASSSGANRTMSATDKRVREVCELEADLQKRRQQLSAAEIAAAETAIEKAKTEIIEIFRQDAKDYLVKKFGVPEPDAESLIRQLKITKAEHTSDDNLLGSVSSLTGELKIYFGPDLPRSASLSVTFLHEFEHLINHARFAALIEHQPEAAINAIVDDCLKGVMAGGYRLESRYDSQAARKLVNKRLTADKFSQTEVAFVKVQLRDYLTQTADIGEVAPMLDVNELKAWLQAKRPPVQFPDPANEQLLLHEMVREIDNANFVFAGVDFRSAVQSDPALEELARLVGKPLQDNPSAPAHYFRGVADSVLGVREKSTYNFGSVEEMAANRIPMFKAYEEACSTARDQLLKFMKRADAGQVEVSADSKKVLAFCKDVLDKLELKKGEFELERLAARQRLDGKPSQLSDVLKDIDRRERKAIQLQEKRLFDNLHQSAEGQATLLEWRNMSDGRAVVNALDGRTEIVQELRDLTRREMTLRASRDAQEALVNGNPIEIARTQQRLNDSLGSLIETSSYPSIRGTLQYLAERGLISADNVLLVTPTAKLELVIEALLDRVPQEQILKALTVEQFAKGADSLVKAGLMEDALRAAIFECSPDLRKAIAESLFNYKDWRNLGVIADAARFMTVNRRDPQYSEIVQFFVVEARLPVDRLCEWIPKSEQLRLKRILSEEISNLNPAERPLVADSNAGKAMIPGDAQRLDAAAPTDVALPSAPSCGASEITALTKKLDDLRAQWKGRDLPSPDDIARIEKLIQDNKSLQTAVALLNAGALDKAAKAVPAEFKADFDKLILLERFSQEVAAAAKPTLAKMGLPPMKFDLSSPNPGLSGWQLKAQAVNKYLGQKSADLLPAVLQRLAEAEQATLFLRAMQNRLGQAGPVTTTNLEREYANLLGGNPPKELLEFVSNGKLPPLSADEIKRLEQLSRPKKEDH